MNNTTVKEKRRSDWMQLIKNNFIKMQMQIVTKLYVILGFFGAGTKKGLDFPKMSKIQFGAAANAKPSPTSQPKK